ncbi:MAG: autotransporter-associated beta strand repeat-containing protein [Verrucomicrobia bacterium]|nr:autotransporter-associated beta strand repeat-containing protein [Verrucomicrobiota bacterium]
MISLTASPATRVWTGASATSGNWTTAANWQGNVVPVAGDVLQFVDTGARKTSNTNNFPAGTSFSVINCFGAGSYRLRGNSVTITNSLNVGNPAGSHIVDFDITFAPIEGSPSIDVFAGASSLTINGDVHLGTHTLLIDGAGDVTVAGVISGAGGVYKLGSGTLSYTGLGANTYSGLTVVSGGVLRLNRYNLGAGGGGLVFTSATAIAGDLAIGDFVSTLIGDIVVLDRDNQIANSSTVSVYPTGSLELSDENETVGELRLRGGTVTTGSGLLAVDGGIYASLPINVSKDSVIAGRLSLGSRGDGPQLFDIAQGVQLNITAQISGPAPATLIKTNRGELVLVASNTFSGDVEIKGGTLSILHGSALGNTNGQTRLLSGFLATDEPGAIGVPEHLIVPGPAGLLQARNGSVSWLGPVLLNDDLDIQIATNKSLTFVGQISGPAGFRKYGPGTLTLKTPYTNTYAGSTLVLEGDMILDGVLNQPVIPSGPLIIGASHPVGSQAVSYIKQHQIGDGVAVTVRETGELALNGFSDTIGSLEGTGKVLLGSGALQAGDNDSSTLFSGVISGSGTFTKSGTGTLTLTGTNTYSGVTSNLNGTLLVHGVLSSSSAVQVRPGSVLGGTGQVQAVSVFVNGTVSPGASPGNLKASLVLMPLGTLSVELNGTTPGVDYDQLTVSGSVTLGGNLQVSLGFASTVGNSFTILNKTGPGAISGTFNGLPEGATFLADGVPFQITYVGGNGNDVVLTRAGAAASNITGISAVTPEKLQITGQGIPFVTYILEATTTLAAPIPWTPIATNAANGSGIYEFVDALGEAGNPLFPVRFYRVVMP